MARAESGGILLYHFTHVSNLAKILEAGEISCDTAMQAATQLQVEVGDRGVKDRRRRRGVLCGPGGVVSDYVPFYFAPRSPMLYVIVQGGVPEYQEGEDPLVYLVTDIATIADIGLRYVFSDGNCANAITDVFDDLADLDQIDWDIMRARYWNDTAEDPDRMRRRMAEFLVHDRVPFAAINRIAVKSEGLGLQVQSQLRRARSDLTVEVQRSWYYG